MHYQIVGHDNRGTNVHPFGFIYLGDKGYDVGRIGYGAHRDDPDPYAVWPCRESPPNYDPTLLVRAKDYLRKHFPNAQPLKKESAA